MAFCSYESRKGSGKKLKVHFDLPDDEDYPNSKRKHASKCSVSSESSDDCDDNNKDDNGDSKYGGYGSPVWSFQGGSVPQSPPVQFMNSPNGYDPNRIPSSVFGNRPTSPMDWSVASNESLFSIHLGNNSFSSRDHALAAYNNKSGELPRTSDVSNMPTVTTSCDNQKNDVDMEKQSVSSSSSSSESSDSDVESKKTETSGTSDASKTPDDDHHKEPAKDYTSVSCRSVGSDRSFQFPILAPDGVRTSSSTVESEKQEKSEKGQEEEEPEKQLEPPTPQTEKPPKQSVRSWCFCFSCSPCF